MPSIRIAAAQSTSVPGDIDANVAIHKKFMAAARQARVDVLVFPELSLTGYELPLLHKLALKPTATCLNPLRYFVRETRMTVIVGVPLATEPGAAPAIGAITFFADGRTSMYRKQHLATRDEGHIAESVGCSGPHSLFGQSIALAIGADTWHERHAASAAASEASMYVASVLVSEAAHAVDTGNLRRYAAKFGFGALMCNHGGASGGYLSSGKSTFWAPGGKEVVAAPGQGDCLVIATNRSGDWDGEVVDIRL
jgi:predicted amidohydrolase